MRSLVTDQGLHLNFFWTLFFLTNSPKIVQFGSFFFIQSFQNLQFESLFLYTFWLNLQLESFFLNSKVVWSCRRNLSLTTNLFRCLWPTHQECCPLRVRCQLFTTIYKISKILRKIRKIVQNSWTRQENLWIYSLVWNLSLLLAPKYRTNEWKINE